MSHSPRSSALANGPVWFGLSPNMLKLTAAAAVAASLVGQGLSTALLGSRAGLEKWILVFDFLGGLCSQVFATLGVLVAMTLLSSSLRTARLPLLYRLLAVPAAGVAVLLCVAATQRALPTAGLVALACTSSYVMFFSAALTVGHASTRGLGLALAFSGFCTTLRMLPALALLLPFTGTLTNSSRVLALLWTASLIGVMLAAGTGLNPRRSALNRVLLGTAGLVVLLLVLGAAAAMRAGATFLPVVVQRTLENLQTFPILFGDGTLERVLTALLLTVSTALLFASPTRAPLAAALSLALLARGCADVPALGLQLIIAALLAPLSVTAEGPDSA